MDICVASFCEDGAYSFNHLNTSQEIHAEINEIPLDAFLFVFFLFKNEHVMVEELLQLLICEVDTQLFKAVELWFFCGWEGQTINQKVLYRSTFSCSTRFLLKTNKDFFIRSTQIGGALKQQQKSRLGGARWQVFEIFNQLWDFFFHKGSNIENDNEEVWFSKRQDFGGVVNCLLFKGLHLKRLL